MKASNYLVREETLAGWPVRVISYEIEGRYFAAVENVDPGAKISRAEATTREEAERIAVAKASERLAMTRRIT